MLAFHYVKAAFIIFTNLALSQERVDAIKQACRLDFLTEQGVMSRRAGNCFLRCPSFFHDDLPDEEKFMPFFSSEESDYQHSSVTQPQIFVM